jgi:hypothetical protein
MSRAQNNISGMSISGNVLKVTLQYTTEIDAASVRKRRQVLIKVFRLAENEIEPGAVQVDLSSLSPFSQTVVADIQEKRYSATVKKLRKLNVRVDPIVLRQLV